MEKKRIALSPGTRAHLIASLGFFVLGFNLFIWKLQSVPTVYFDEIRYVPAARQFLVHGRNENWSHPPLGKMLIAFGIRLFGDNLLGWRFMSVLFGSLTLMAFYWIAALLLEDRESAAEATFLTLVNQLLFVEARAALLDIFMFQFISTGLVFLLFYMAPARGAKRKRHLWPVGVCFGLALAVKWFALVPLLLCIGYLALSELKGSRNRLRELKKWVLPLVGVPLLVYFSVYLVCLGMKHPRYAAPLTPAPSVVMAPPLQSAQKVVPRPPESSYGVSDFISLQTGMLKAQLAFDNHRQPYRSQFWSWPLMNRVIWYTYGSSNFKDQTVRRGIVLLGNPLVIWVGLLGVLICLSVVFRRRSVGGAKNSNDFKVALFIAWFYLGCFLCWCVVPRKVTFFYYYYPPAMFLGLAILFSFKYLKVSRPIRYGYYLSCLALFVYFYPILSGSSLDAKSFDQRMWLKGWGLQSPG